MLQGLVSVITASSVKEMMQSAGQGDPTGLKPKDCRRKRQSAALWNYPGVNKHEERRSKLWQPAWSICSLLSITSQRKETSGMVSSKFPPAGDHVEPLPCCPGRRFPAGWRWTAGRSSSGSSECRPPPRRCRSRRSSSGRWGPRCRGDNDGVRWWRAGKDGRLQGSGPQPVVQRTAHNIVGGRFFGGETHNYNFN